MRDAFPEKLNYYCIRMSCLKFTYCTSCKIMSCNIQSCFSIQINANIATLMDEVLVLGVASRGRDMYVTGPVAGMLFDL